MYEIETKQPRIYFYFFILFLYCFLNHLPPKHSRAIESGVRISILAIQLSCSLSLDISDEHARRAAFVFKKDGSKVGDDLHFTHVYV